MVSAIMTTEKQVLDFLTRVLMDRYGVAAEKITRQARVCEDLKLDGDDAVEFFDHFHETFYFDADTFAYDRYFNPDGFSTGILDLLRGKKKPALRTMTLEMLLDAAVSGRWQDNQVQP